ncbi:MAG TPA: RidA family protein [Vicinamibacterales bacterium]|jgi:enamine deaminase RidA (YjgF/YER057c/UK114 family)|nr:RidA family protein [Vicinamibacterales bacterium]
MIRLALTLSLALVLPVHVFGQALQRINPPGLSTPATYSHIVKAGKTLYIAGQVGADASGKIAGETMVQQLEQVFKNIEIALKSQGADFSHVARITIYTTDIDAVRAPEAAAVRAKYLGANRPASTLVGVTRLASPEYKVEIETTAVLP